MAINVFQYQESIRPYDNRHAKAGCLLVVLLFLPVLGKSFHPLLLGLLIGAYVSIVVPLIAGYYSPVPVLRFIRKMYHRLGAAGNFIVYVMVNLVFTVEFLKILYYQSELIQTSLAQVLIFYMCEKIFCPSERMCGIIFLLFYNVVLYAVRALTKRKWSSLIYNENSGISNILPNVAQFMVARLNKGIASISILLTLSYQARNLEPSISFIVITLMYYCLTQFQDAKYLMELIEKLDIAKFGGYEEYYIPMILRSINIFLSTIIITLFLYVCGPCVGLSCLFLATFAIFNNVKMAYYRLNFTCIAPYSYKRNLTCKFNHPTKEELLTKGDTCPICLDENNRISKARITPCGHIFHTSCLITWLIDSANCPLCMKDLTEYIVRGTSPPVDDFNID